MRRRNAGMRLQRGNQSGFAIALQAFYVPTTSPIGYDLTNALWARLGY